MRRYIKRPRQEPMNEEFIALAILIGPLAWLVAGVIWLCRSGMPLLGFREEEDEQ
jgi:hypothetical protein